MRHIRTSANHESGLIVTSPTRRLTAATLSGAYSGAAGAALLHHAEIHFVDAYIQPEWLQLRLDQPRVLPAQTARGGHKQVERSPAALRHQPRRGGGVVCQITGQARIPNRPEARHGTWWDGRE